MLDSTMNSIATDPGKTRETVRLQQRASVELPTLMLIVIAYGGWLALTAAYDHWPLWVVAPAVVVLLTLHSSLQHEIIHGHPTRWSWINRLLGMVPLSFWLPFERYRSTTSTIMSTNGSPIRSTTRNPIIGRLTSGRGCRRSAARCC